MWDCVKEAERLSGSDHAKFVRFEDQMKQEGWKATPADVKRMEVLFLTFRDYAQLRYGQAKSSCAVYFHMCKILYTFFKRTNFINNIKASMGKILRNVKNILRLCRLLNTYSLREISQKMTKIRTF